MIKVGSVVIVNKNVSSDGKYDFTVDADILNGGKYSFTEGKKGVVVSVDESSKRPYQVRFDEFTKYFDSEVLNFKKRDLKLFI